MCDEDVPPLGRWGRGDTRLLAPHPASVGEARRMVRDVLRQARREDLVETAQLLVSEVVTNALVHAGPPMRIQAFVADEGLRVEVNDGSAQVPTPRIHPATAGTGRGVRLLQQLVDRWGVDVRTNGKTIWFELSSGDRLQETASAPVAAADDAHAPSTAAGDVCDVVLLNTPLLLHVAWQEHAQAMLREYLLVSLDADDPTDALQAHAAASDAISLLYQHLPRPHLGDEPEELMTKAVEPGVSQPRAVIPVPRASVPRFEILDATMDSALALADAGVFLTAPIQPELRELRRWLCTEVSRQSRGEPPTRWSSPAHVPPAVVVHAGPVADEVGILEGQALIAADDSNRIVAISRPACELLGYREPSQLLGRRLVAIIPARYHQAHLAGFTLHLSNGRRPLLDRTVVVPVLRADGTEVPVELFVETRRQPSGRPLFIARIHPAQL